MKVKGRLAKFGHFSAYLAVRFFVCLLQALPIETCRRIARGLAWLMTEVIVFRAATRRRKPRPRVSKHVGRHPRGWPGRCGNTCF